MSEMEHHPGEAPFRKGTTARARATGFTRKGRPGSPPRPRQFRGPKAPDQVVVDHAHRLHEGIADRRAHEREAPRMVSLPTLGKPGTRGRQVLARRTRPGVQCAGARGRGPDRTPKGMATN